MRTGLLQLLGQSACGKRRKEHMRRTIFDPRPSYMAQKDLALQFQSLLRKCTPSAVGLHVMAEPEVEEVVDEVEHQERLEGKKDVSSNAQASQPELCSIDNFSCLLYTSPSPRDA